MDPAIVQVNNDYIRNVVHEKMSGKNICLCNVVHVLFWTDMFFWTS